MNAIVRHFHTVVALLATISASVAADGTKPAPPLHIKEWIKGKPVNLAAGKGSNVYVIEFWATWCGPCRVSIPHLSELQRKFRDKNVTIVGVSREPAATIRPYVEKLASQMDYTVAVDVGPSARATKG